MNGVRFFTSWSGGKDSCLAHYKATQQGGVPHVLFTMFEENEERSRSHALPLDVMKAQAAALDLPLVIRGATWDSYEHHFLELLEQFKQEGVSDGVFGDIDLEPHLEWVEKTCAKKDVTPHHPLWKMERKAVLKDLLDAGFEAMIVVVKDEKLPSSFLGKVMTEEVIAEMESYDVDACGEEGEFHTVVINGPNFRQPVPLNKGEIVQSEGYSFLTVSLA